MKQALAVFFVIAATVGIPLFVVAVTHWTLPYRNKRP